MYHMTLRHNKNVIIQSHIQTYHDIFRLTFHYFLQYVPKLYSSHLS